MPSAIIRIGLRGSGADEQRADYIQAQQPASRAVDYRVSRLISSVNPNSFRLALRQCWAPYAFSLDVVSGAEL